MGHETMSENYEKGSVGRAVSRGESHQMEDRLQLNAEELKASQGAHVAAVKSKASQWQIRDNRNTGRKKTESE